MPDAPLPLSDLAAWGGASLDDFQREFGEDTYERLKRDDLIDEIATDWGIVVFLTPKGRRTAGFTNLYHPTVQALVNNVAVRRAVKTLEGEGYGDAQPRVYGKAHARMTDPEGKFVCVTGRWTTFNSQSIRTLCARLFDGSHPELSRLILFVPTPKRFRTLFDRYPVELRDAGVAPERDPLRERVGKKTPKAERTTTDI